MVSHILFSCTRMRLTSTGKELSDAGVKNTAQLEPQELPDLTPYLTNSLYYTFLISGWVILLQGI